MTPMVSLDVKTSSMTIVSGITEQQISIGRGMIRWTWLIAARADQDNHPGLPGFWWSQAHQ